MRLTASVIKVFHAGQRVASHPRSMLVTSQLPVARWQEYPNDPTVADVLL